jgi:hypothetical protein
MTGRPQFYNGKLLFENGKIAMDPECCCDVLSECCCGACLRFEWTLEGYADTLAFCDCPNINDTWVSPNVFPTIIDGVCVYSINFIPSPNPFDSAACGAKLILNGEIICPVEGGILIRGGASEIATSDLPVDPLVMPSALRGRACKIVPQVDPPGGPGPGDPGSSFPGQPPLATQILFGQEITEDCDLVLDLTRTEFDSGYCNVTAAQGTMRIIACPTENISAKAPCTQATLDRSSESSEIIDDIINALTYDDEFLENYLKLLS